MSQKLLNLAPMVRFFAVSLILVGLSGCGGNKGNEMIAANNDTNIKRLGTMYGFFHLKNQFKGPKDEAEFKKFIGEQDASRLELAGISGSKVDELFLSERDKQPFKIRYGVNTQLRGPSLPVIFEANGLEGKRQVAFTGGLMQEVDAAKYDELFSGKGDQGQAPPTGDPRGKR